MWVKICGNTNLEDAQAAIQAGADALGFIFVPTSPRVITRKRASEILEALPETVLTVAVVANESPEFLKGLLRVCPFRAIQFHGEERPEEVLAFKGEARLIKAIRVKGAKSLEAIPRYQGVDAILLDTYHPTKRGGTGLTLSAKGSPQSFGDPPRSYGGIAGDWDLVKEAKRFRIPIVVAGGLNPSNVGELIRQAPPYGVDVASGVESAPGRKDHALLREFILKAKS